MEIYGTNTEQHADFDLLKCHSRTHTHTPIHTCFRPEIQVAHQRRTVERSMQKSIGKSKI